MVWAQATFQMPSKVYWRLSGTAGRTSVRLDLVKSGDSLYGEMVLVNGPDIDGMLSAVRSKPLEIGGRIDAKGNFRIKSFFSDYPSMEGVVKAGILLTGTFTPGKSAVPIRFELREEASQGSVDMNVYSLKQKVDLVKKAGSPRGSIRMTLLSPVESGNHLLSDSLRKLIFSVFGPSSFTGRDPDSLLAANLEAFKRDYISSNEDLYRQMPDAGALNWELLRFMHVLCNRAEMLSFYVLSYAFTGGAHGMTNMETRNVNLSTGKVISLGDVIAEENFPALASLLAGRIREMHGIQPNQKLTENGFFTDEIKPTENFYVCPAGVGFIYNQYDIAPYSFGPVDVFLTADEVKALLRPGFRFFEDGKK